MRADILFLFPEVSTASFWSFMHFYRRVFQSLVKSLKWVHKMAVSTGKFQEATKITVWVRNRRRRSMHAVGSKSHTEVKYGGVACPPPGLF